MASEAAEAIIEARRARRVLAPLGALAPATPEAGYAIQKEVALRLGGLPPAGFKIGATTKQMQSYLGLSGPAGGFLPKSGLRATPSGLAVVGVGLTENLEANRVELTYLAIGLVFLFLAIRLRSIIRSLLSLVPVLIAVGATSLVAYVLDLKLSPMTAVGGPLVIAACTEFTSLILLRFVEERRRGFEPREAMEETASRTGRAFVVSALAARGLTRLRARTAPPAVTGPACRTAWSR